MDSFKTCGIALLVTMLLTSPRTANAESGSSAGCLGLMAPQSSLCCPTVFHVCVCSSSGCDE